MVPFKGSAPEWLTAQLVRDIKKAGYFGLLTLKSDQEPAIRDVLAEVAKSRGEARTILEEAPRSDSSGNGMVERAVRSIEEMVRVQKMAFEKRVGFSLGVQHPLFAWLVEHCADLLNKLQVGKDGRTAFERLKGNRRRAEALPRATCFPLLRCGQGARD